VKYYIIAGERSGDLHGGNLVRALQKEDPNAMFRGFGGDEMKKNGVELTVHYREMAFMGFISLATSLIKIYKFISLCKNDILNYNPDVIILIDYGGFNLQIAKFAKTKDLNVYYYIPPKVWAWYQSRAKQLKAAVNHMFVILPFEKNFYKKFSFEVDYVGNPVLDAVKSFASSETFKADNNLQLDKKLVAFLPGSRKIELKRIVPLMGQIADANPDVQFVVAAVNNLSEELYKELKNKQNVGFVYGQTYDLLYNADAAIVTSGTATLETALIKVPQVVIYKTSFIEYTIARTLVSVEYISLVNLIAEKDVVKELIQQDASKDLLNDELGKLLFDSNYISKMRQEYDRLYDILNTGSASENAARLMVKYLLEEKSS
jgi:lipid-A-disaccharide synthase